MSTLDQAFIRAYQANSSRKQAAAPAAAAPTATPQPAASHTATPSGVTARRYFVDSAHPTEYSAHYGDAAAAPPATSTESEIELLSSRIAEVNAAATTIEEPVATPLRAAYETHRFAWPRKLEVLIAAAGGEFAEFATELEQRCHEGRKTLLVTGAERGAGRSLIALSLARLAANRNLRTVIVDLDIKQPGLNELLGLRPELGWEDAAAERLPVSDVLVESHDDRLTLMPLRNGLANPRALAGNSFLSAAISELREHFDCILLDAAPLHDDSATIELATALGGHSLDDGLVVRDRRRTTPQQVHDVGRRLAALGIRRWDVAENFTELQGY
jgi:Mrp family chromosome partitioning ATPase